MSDKSTELPYRRCVGIMLINSEGKVWIGDRIGYSDDSHDTAWQMPQGGIDKGEEPATAALRELAEEAGTDQAEIVQESEHWYNYDLPKEIVGKALKGKYRGQTQRWFLLRFTGTDGDIDITADDHQEFSAWRWADMDELADLIVPFKRDVYTQVVNEFQDTVKTLAGK
ncbi:MAG: RNA pyrophosphohydrolase [Rhodobiaceae bacterium]|nr:RNA pyrophosphohydrolase [Rhodobiaceae bacterium]MCR9243083.1 RNA pyrophosphohydrolase [Rhodobiaceae bacterium]